MEKIWFALIDGQKEGPLSVQELRHHPLVTPDTLVWKEGFARWIPIRKVPELKIIFADASPTGEPSEEEEELSKMKELRAKGKDELVLDLENEPPTLLFWLLVTLMLIAYLMYKFYQTD